MSSVQTIKLGNVSVTVSLETETPASTQPQTPAKGLASAPGKSVFNTPYQISSDLGEFLGWPKGTLMTYSDVSFAVCEYARRNGLVEDHVIRPDAALSKLFAQSEKGDVKGVTYMQLPLYIWPHFIGYAKKEATPAPTPATEPASNEELLFNRVAERLKFFLKQTVLVNPSFKHYKEQHAGCWCKRYRGQKPTAGVEDMERYMSHYYHNFGEGAYEIQEKRTLFRTVMKKNGLSYEEDIFQSYMDSTKTTERKPKENRYQRMDAFIKSL
jgi:hypothetical protein